MTLLLSLVLPTTVGSGGERHRDQRVCGKRCQTRHYNNETTRETNAVNPGNAPSTAVRWHRSKTHIFYTGRHISARPTLNSPFPPSAEDTPIASRLLHVMHKQRSSSRASVFSQEKIQDGIKSNILQPAPFVSFPCHPIKYQLISLPCQAIT